MVALPGAANGAIYRNADVREAPPARWLLCHTLLCRCARAEVTAHGLTTRCTRSTRWARSVHTLERRGAAFVGFAPSFPGAPRTAVQRGWRSLPCMVAGAVPSKVVVVGGGPAGFMAAIRYSCPVGPRMYV
jgi:hypothetical protein